MLKIFLQCLGVLMMVMVLGPLAVLALPGLFIIAFICIIIFVARYSRRNQGN